MLPVLFFATVIPISLVLWVFNLFVVSGNTSLDAYEPLSPARCLIACLFPVLVVKWGLKKHSLDKTGAVAALVVGFIMTVSNYCFFAGMIVFFLLASKATKFRSHMKQKIEADHKEGGQRNWVQVICNGGVATELAILYMFETGCGERPVDFHSSYGSSWLNMAVLGALACACGDTFASEFGTVIGKGKPRLITTFQQVPKGTNGGITVVGVLASTVGGAVVGAAFYLALVTSCQTEVLFNCPQQLATVMVGALGGLIGSLIDSVIGALFQYSGFDKKRNCIVELPGPDVVHICGSSYLNNHSVNLVSSLITAMVIPYVALSLWD